MSRLFAVAFLLAGQCADVFTYAAMDPANEANPIVQTLGPVPALAFKAVAVTYALWADNRLHNVATLAILLFGGALGFIGAATNVL